MNCAMLSVDYVIFWIMRGLELGWDVRGYSDKVMLFGNKPDLPLPGCKISNDVGSGVSCSKRVLIRFIVGTRLKL